MAMADKKYGGECRDKRGRLSRVKKEKNLKIALKKLNVSKNTQPQP
jgi:hypothetical protein